MDQRTPVALVWDAVEAARTVALEAMRRAASEDRDGGFPTKDIVALEGAGLLAAAVPRASGGAGLGAETGARRLRRVLTAIGAGSLPLGRLYEGHVNALALVALYASPSARERWFADARDGHLFGVWNTQPAEGGLTAEPVPGGVRLTGVKTFASGAGHVTRALVTARPPGDPEAAPQMLLVDLEPGARADLSSWRAHGMRASATGTLDFTGLVVPAEALLGGPGDYHAEPNFSGGAWRFAAVQVGGIEAVLDAWRGHLAVTGRGGDPHQLARLGEGALACETAALWVDRAAETVTEPDVDPETAVAYVNLARLAVERAGLDVLERAQRSVGLAGFLRDHPLERLSRDLATYLRQPAPDRALTTAARHVLASREPAGLLWPDVAQT